MLFTLIARVPAAGTADFAGYETAVLPRLRRHGGEMRSRVRHVHDNGDWTEIHIVAFTDQHGYEAYRADPDRAKHGALLTRSQADITLLPVTDV
jgi:uncharacterized protein (DUF1330 family)